MSFRGFDLEKNALFGQDNNVKKMVSTQRDKGEGDHGSAEK